MSAQVELVGQVVAGRGMGTRRVLRYREELQAIVKQPLYPGTLNILLNQPLRLLEASGSAFDAEGGMVWPASLGRVDVWIYRWRTCPLHIVEVISSIYLREHFNLNDGDDVTLCLSGAQIGAIAALGRFAWAALWIGRRNAFFLRDTCHTATNRTMYWSKRLGALQQQPDVIGARQLSIFAKEELIRGVVSARALVSRSLKTKA